MKKIALLFSFFLVSLSNFAQLGLGLVSQYYFSGNANDMVGTNHGIVRGATLAPDRFGNLNSAYCFNGQNNLINLGTSTSLKSGTMSISFWAKTTGTLVNSNAYSNHPFIFTKANNLGGAYEAYFVGVFKPTNEVDAATSDLIGNQTVSFSGVTATQNIWKHIVYMFTQDSTYLFVNNLLTNQLYKGYSSSFWPGDSVVLGFVGNIPIPGNTYSWLNGCLDDFRIYNRKLNRDEITQLYNEVPKPIADFSAPNPICSGTAKSFTDNSSGFPNTWAWTVSPNAGVIITSPSSQNPVISFANPGTYIVSLVTGNSGGLSSPVSKTISVSPCTMIDKQNNNTDGFNIFPNPTSGKVYFELSGNKNIEFILLNSLGQVIKNFDSAYLKKNQFEIDLSAFANGIYFIKIGSQNLNVNRKLIIDK